MLTKREFSALIFRIQIRYNEYCADGFSTLEGRLAEQSSRTKIDNLIDLIACNLAVILFAGIASGVPNTAETRTGVFNRFIVETTKLAESGYLPEEGLVDQLRELPTTITIEHLKERMQQACKLMLRLLEIV
jgi:hypothetical protein